ncbi:phage terminase small subunit, partial [Ralstonia solanacearum]
QLKQVQSVERKAELKRKLLPEYAAWIRGVLDADTGAQDEVFMTVMVWL